MSPSTDFRPPPHPKRQTQNLKPQNLDRAYISRGTGGRDVKVVTDERLFLHDVALLLGLGFRVQGLGFRNLGFKLQGVCRVSRIKGL